MRKRQFKKHFDREHTRAHWRSDNPKMLTDDILDLAEEIQAHKLEALEYKRNWEIEKRLRQSLSKDLEPVLKRNWQHTQKRIKEALIAGGSVGVAVGILVGYLMRAYS